MEEKKYYTIIVFTENQAGLLSRVVSVFSRRHINVESLTTSRSSMPGIHRFTIVAHVDEIMVKKLVAQLEKQVDVLKAFYYEPEEIVYQELALYKVPTHIFSNSTSVEKLIRSHNARVLEIEPEYIVLEKTGHERETEAFFKELEKIGIYEFVRSGRIAIVKPMERLNRYLKSLEEEAV
ncbi:MAG: acetolactate synthase small subunit [Phaeodactylibacter sp.]|nr:acetolactate synthase small subunit [Phaeodactylibacter sp.]MCB9052302.1 acetolactate synthase small subunit [Lewinellaceae bacterium]MCB9304827.1 acetolactate synthase small subunit [Lewinellaceae bacterium]